MAIIGLLLIVLGYLGVLFGRIIQAAVSRQREFLADAAAVRFTRSPDGIAGALKKIAEDSRGSVVTDHHAQEVGHLFFANGVTGALSSAFSTHPPLEERIRRIDSSGDGRIETSPPRPSREGPAERKKGGAARRPTGVELPLAAAIVATAGAPGPDHVAYARNLLERMDEELRTRLRSPEGAVAVVIALLLSDEEDVRTLQSAAATEILGPESVETASLLRPKVAELGPSGRLPVLDLALPALRQLSGERSAALRRAVRPLVRADGRIRTFDFALFHVLWQAVPAGEDRRPGGGRKDVPLSRLRDEVERLLSAMARSGADDESAARRAFDAGAARLGKTGAPWALRPEGELDLEHVDRALSRLESASPAVKKALLEAAGEVVRFDGRARVAEVEMLRAVAEALDAPMPPVLTPANGREADGS